MKLKHNKKGSLEDMMSTPLAIGFLLLFMGVFVFMIDKFDTSIQANTNLPSEGVNVSSDLNTFTTERLPLIPAFFLLAIFIGTIVMVWFNTDPSDPLFILSWIIFSLYTLFIGGFKLFYDKISEISVVSDILVNAAFIPLYMDNLFIFQSAWFSIMFIVWGIRK